MGRFDWEKVGSIYHHVFDRLALSLKTTLYGDDGSGTYSPAKVSSDGNLQVDIVSGSVTVGDGSGDLTVDGTVAVSSVAGTVTVTGDSGGSLTVDGTVAVSNFPASQAVTVTSGAITIDDGDGPLTVDGAVEVGGTPGTTAVHTTARIAAASLTSDSSYAAFITNPGIAKILTIYNTTEREIYLSFNASTDHLIALIGTIVS